MVEPKKQKRTKQQQQALYAICEDARQETEWRTHEHIAATGVAYVDTGDACWMSNEGASTAGAIDFSDDEARAIFGMDDTDDLVDIVSDYAFGKCFKKLDDDMCCINLEIVGRYMYQKHRQD